MTNKNEKPILFLFVILEEMASVYEYHFVFKPVILNRINVKELVLIIYGNFHVIFKRVKTFKPAYFMRRYSISKYRCANTFSRFVQGHKPPQLFLVLK